MRVTARVRMVTPTRGVATMRVAMRVQVTEQDEDERSITRAVRSAVRTLALVALLVALLVAGAQRASAWPAGADGSAGPAGAVTAPSGGELDGGCGHHQRGTHAPSATSSSPSAATSTAALHCAAHAHAVAPPAPPRPAATAGPWSWVAEAHRMPRPALAATVVVSPD